MVSRGNGFFGLKGLPPHMWSLEIPDVSKLLSPKRCGSQRVTGEGFDLLEDDTFLLGKTSDER